MGHMHPVTAIAQGLLGSFGKYKMEAVEGIHWFLKIIVVVCVCVMVWEDLSDEDGTCSRGPSCDVCKPGLGVRQIHHQALCLCEVALGLFANPMP